MNSFVSKHGLKYTLSDQAFEMLEEKPALYEKLDAKIEAAEVFPSFVSVCVFTALTLSGYSDDWYMTVLYSMLGYVLATIVSTWATVFFIPVITPILSLYQFFSRFFVQFIVVIALSLVMLDKWYVALVYIVASAVVKIIMMFSIGGYKQREVFNDAVAKKLYYKY